MLEGDRIGDRFRLVRRQPGKSSDAGTPNEVWLAYDERLGRDVVLKRAGEPEDELRAQASINHEHVITLYEYLSLPGSGEWLVLEYAPRGSLAEQPNLTPQQAARVGAQIAGALIELHAKGIVHCDVKPANIVVAENGAAKLADFGAAYRFWSAETLPVGGRFSYTPAYAAPELVRGAPEPASDVYSLATTVYALVVGASPNLPGHPRAEAEAALGPLAVPLEAMRASLPTDRPDTAEVQRLFDAVANGIDPAATTSPASAEVAPRPAVVPAQLPADVHGFAGRGSELHQLDALLEFSAERPPPTAVVISAVSGTAGVGKTALAVHWAHRVAGQFPDGQLYANLRGFDPSGQVLDPGSVVRGFLEALGTTPEQIPDGLDAQTALYRSLLAGRRVLVLLDNARDSAQLRPLLPGAPGCLVIATSRNDLSGLVSREGARLMPLDLLSSDDARSLLEHRLGQDRIAAEPAAVDEIVEGCAQLPLALAIVAARAAIRPRFPLAATAAELRDSHNRFAALAAEGPDSDVRAVFSWSYDQLSPDAARLFRLLGLHPGPDFAAPAAASLAGVPPQQATGLLAELTAANVLAEPAPGRYALHDLLRSYAASVAQTEETDADREAARLRMLDHYLHTARSTAPLLNPGQDAIELEPPVAGTLVEPIADHREAMTWLEAENRVLLAAIGYAETTGHDLHAWRLSWALSNFLDRLVRLQDRLSIWDAALRAARRLGDLALEARALRNLSTSYTKLGRADEAATSLEAAIGLFGRLGDRAGEAHSRRVMGMLYMTKGDNEAALEQALQALAHYRASGYPFGSVLNDIGWYQIQLGEYDQAIASCEESLEQLDVIGDRTMAAATWDTLGYANHLLGNHVRAIECYEKALDLQSELVQLDDLSQILDHLGDAHQAAGHDAEARDCWQRSLEILEQLGRPADAVRAKLDRDPPSGV